MDGLALVENGLQASAGRLRLLPLSYHSGGISQQNLAIIYFVKRLAKVENSLLRLLTLTKKQTRIHKEDKSWYHTDLGHVRQV